MKKISVITVCYNALDDLKKTITSLSSQTYKDIEYVVIDGGSTDGTIAYVEENAAYFNGLFGHFSFVSEPDDGIYDAMNKGAAYAGGQFLLFLNAGDVLKNSDVLETIRHELTDEIDFLYGDTVFVHAGQENCKKPVDIKCFDGFCGMPFCHQSVFIKRETMLKYKYNLAYKICADFEFVLHAYKSGCKFQYIPVTIAVFDASDGLSARHPHALKKEVIKINRHHGTIGRMKAFWEYIKVYYRQCGSKIKRVLFRRKKP